MSYIPTLKKTAIVSLIIIVSFAMNFQYLKKGDPKNQNVKKILNQTNDKYIILNTRYVNNKQICDLKKLPNHFKLVLEMNFNCSKCFLDLMEIYKLYKNLSNICEIEFCLVTTIKSFGYIEFFLTKTLGNYNLWIIQQSFVKDNTDLYLLDKANNIVMTGNIITYPFLKNEYIKKLKMINN